MSRRAWVVVGLAVVLMLTAAGALGVPRTGARCGSTVHSLSGARSSSPFLDAAGRTAQPDAHRDRVVAALDRAPVPYGPVLGAVGFDYGQWAQLSAYAQGLGVRTRDNPDFTLLDDQSLKPRWSVQVDTARSTYDADARTYLVATMPSKGSPDLVALDAGTGRRRWCASLGGRHVLASAPFATQLYADGGAAVLGPGNGPSSERIVRLSSAGEPRWTRTLDADSGAFLGSLGDGLLVAGGRQQFALLDPSSLHRRVAGPALVALDAATGKTAWTVPAPARADLHVLGTSGNLVVAQEWGTSGHLAAYDERGHLTWRASPAAGRLFDAALLGGRVVVRDGNRWSAYDAGSGRRIWSRTMPHRPQFLPYGFQLDGVPLLDADHALLGTTTALRTLDLRTGTTTSVALPTDGISTTYWPYAVVVTDHLLAVATNTSAVVVRRE